MNTGGYVLAAGLFGGIIIVISIERWRARALSRRLDILDEHVKALRESVSRLKNEIEEDL